MDAIVTAAVISIVLVAVAVAYVTRGHRAGGRLPSLALGLIHPSATWRDGFPTSPTPPGPSMPMGSAAESQAPEPGYGRHPTLARIDRARGETEPRFEGCADPARLERLALALTDEYWGETVWLTGSVPPAAFALVCATLQRERRTIEAALERDSLPAA